MRKQLINKAGFTLIETLVACWVLLLAMGFIVSAFSLIKVINEGTMKNEDSIAIQQIRWMLAQSSNITTNGNTLYFNYHNKDFSLAFDRNRLVKSVGYEIMLQKIDSASFYEGNGCYYLNYQKGKKEYDEEINCQ